GTDKAEGLGIFSCGLRINHFRTTQRNHNNSFSWHTGSYQGLCNKFRARVNQIGNLEFAVFASVALTGKEHQAFRARRPQSGKTLILAVNPFLTKTMMWT